MKSRKIRAYLAVAVAAFLLLAWLLRPAQTPPNANMTVPVARIVKTEFYEPVLNVDIAVPGEVRDGALIEQSGKAILDIGKNMIAGNPPVKGQIDVINFTFFGPGQDGSRRTKFMHLSFDAQNLRELAHMGANGETVLDSAIDGGTWTPANDDIVKNYCAARGGAGFCTRFAA